MDNTILMPVEGKKKFKFTRLTAPQIKVLNENRNNIFKALAVFGGAYVAYETYQSVIDISEEEWKNLLPDELEKLLGGFLQENIDVEECIPVPEIIINETQVPEIINDESEINSKEKEESQIFDNTGKADDILEEKGIDEELIDEITADETHTVIDQEMQEYINSDEFLTDLNDDSATEIIINDEFVEDSENLIFEQESETAEILNEHGLDENLIEEVTISEEELEIDDEMMAYLSSGDILIDLNEDSAEEIIINNEYIDSDEEIFIDDDSDYELENDGSFLEEDEDFDQWEDEEGFEDIDLNDIPDNI